MTSGQSVSTIDSDAVAALMDRAKREIDSGLLPSAQLALAFQGEIITQATLGDATDSTRYPIFSATKPMVASLIWMLMGQGKADPAAKLTDYVPEWAADADAVAAGAPGKPNVTLENVMLHTGGFPQAPMSPAYWMNRGERVAQMTKWRLAWEPGTRHEYHASSGHWVLAEVIDALTEDQPGDFTDRLHEWVTGPMGLPRLLGFTAEEQTDIAELKAVGELATADELEAAWGIRELPNSEVTADAILGFNLPQVRGAGMPGGGGIARAADVALFYQELLHNTKGLFDPAILADVTGNVRTNLPNQFGIPCNRSLGLVLAGDDGMGNARGFGRTGSPQMFGHNGAGGQIAWADPVTGLSFCYLTNGYDIHEVRYRRRVVALASLAAECARAA